ncbi:hypothetical protein [Aquimarina litoralis]|uniref:hypothetical protein n=1 Tax=Aquimarina litoralis TaxID=584605 RepID=UPI001C56256E|nr:hypothetical protein [Aquimarina litoralis]MBW1296414.1 hypothetical protein [Aquimarina litoralis]
MKKIKLLIKGLLFSLLLASCWSEDDDSSGIVIDIEGEDMVNAQTLACSYDEDIILTNHSDGVDYIIECDLELNALMTIEEGTTIIFKASASISVDNEGALSAIGTSTLPINFMGEESIIGFWKGIAFKSSDIRNELNYVVISDAGNAPVEPVWNREKCAIVIINSTINGKLSLKNSIIKNNDGYGLFAENKTTLQDFEDNQFENNSGPALSCSANHVRAIDENSTYRSNEFDGVEIRRSDLDETGSHTWSGIHFNIVGDIEIEKDLTIKPNARLTFEPSTVFMVDNDGSLNAIGTGSEKIVFTGTVTSSPSWKGIGFKSESVLNILEHCEISYAGSDPADNIWVNDKSNITIFKTVDLGRATIRNCQISDGAGYGILVDTNTTLIESGNMFNNLVNRNIKYE